MTPRQNVMTVALLECLLIIGLGLLLDFGAYWELGVAAAAIFNYLRARWREI